MRIRTILFRSIFLRLILAGGMFVFGGNLSILMEDGCCNASKTSNPIPCSSDHPPCSSECSVCFCYSRPVLSVQNGVLDICPNPFPISRRSESCWIPDGPSFEIFHPPKLLS